ncbi:MAG: hypothetical protein MI892_24740, partial [Desulfobacterales bacterium]|nr:hypothetical protein [Desulfobacterales bacterium]
PWSAGRPESYRVEDLIQWSNLASSSTVNLVNLNRHVEMVKALLAGVVASREAAVIGEDMESAVRVIEGLLRGARAFIVYLEARSRNLVSVVSFWIDLMHFLTMEGTASFHS